jgi:hypothetical protein
MKEIYSSSIFVDSGAHSIYNIKVLMHGKRKGKTGRLLAKPPVYWGKGDRPGAGRQDFSSFDLKKGSDFRRYCDSYASFMKKMKGTGVLLANIDAISNPDLTWEIQRFFEEEHGVRPVPIVHCRTPMKYVDRYLLYPLLGVGGLGQGVSRHEYFSWADRFFRHICPKANDYLPLVRTHGFAMTSWELMCRYPWWSVDSATWVKLSAYGWLYVPRWTEEKGFRFDVPPLMVNFSVRPGKEKDGLDSGIFVQDRCPAPREMERQKHYKNVIPTVRANCDRWLQHIGMVLGSVDRKGEVKEFGVVSHHRARSTANLHYLKDLEESRPKWPHPLDYKLVTELTVKYHRDHRGFGL